MFHSNLYIRKAYPYKKDNPYRLSFCYVCSNMSSELDIETWWKQTDVIDTTETQYITTHRQPHAIKRSVNVQTTLGCNWKIWISKALLSFSYRPFPWFAYSSRVWELCKNFYIFVLKVGYVPYSTILYKVYV